jgi:hypothetical protein
MPAIGVSDIWKIFEYKTSETRRNRQAVIEWLESVYAGLDELSKLWREVVSKATAQQPDYEARAKAKRFIYAYTFYSPHNIIFYSRLHEFYRAASEVLGEKNGAFVNTFVDALANVLQGRDEVRRTIERDGGLTTLSPDAQKPFNDVVAAELALQAEIAKLQVVIKTFKATNS